MMATVTPPDDDYQNNTLGSWAQSGPGTCFGTLQRRPIWRHFGRGLPRIPGRSWAGTQTRDGLGPVTNHDHDPFICCALGLAVCWKFHNKYMTEGSLEVKLPATWTDGKAEVGRVRESRREEERSSKQRKSQEKEDAGARKKMPRFVTIFFQ